jgi:hypothetical protein
MKIPDLDKMLLAGVRSPAKLLTGADFERVRALTSSKVARLAKRRRTSAIKPTPLRRHSLRAIKPQAQVIVPEYKQTAEF